MFQTFQNYIQTLQGCMWALVNKGKCFEKEDLVQYMGIVIPLPFQQFVAK